MNSKVVSRAAMAGLKRHKNKTILAIISVLIRFIINIPLPGVMAKSHAPDRS
jgi:hypothetical protein